MLTVIKNINYKECRKVKGEIFSHLTDPLPRYHHQYGGLSPSTSKHVCMPTYV